MLRRSEMLRTNFQIHYGLSIELSMKWWENHSLLPVQGACNMSETFKIVAQASVDDSRHGRHCSRRRISWTCFLVFLSVIMAWDFDLQRNLPCLYATRGLGLHAYTLLSCCASIRVTVTRSYVDSCSYSVAPFS